MRTFASAAVPDRPRRRGFTVVELLVALGMIGLLLALLLPAVQHARATARNATCKSHLRQIGIAAHSYIDVYQVFPGYVHASPGALYSLLPYVGEAVVFEQAERQGDIRNRLIPRLTIYLCPDDPTKADGNVASYAINKGLIRSVAPLRGFLWEPVRPRDVTDGISQSAFFSEAVTNDWSRGYVLPQPRLPRPLSRTEVEVLSERCDSADWMPDSVGRGSVSVASLSAGYNHLLPPNAQHCNFDMYPLDIKPPVSGHAQGTNALLADGSVHFVSSHIDRRIWLSQGTIDGGETGSP